MKRKACDVDEPLSHISVAMRTMIHNDASDSERLQNVKVLIKYYQLSFTASIQLLSKQQVLRDEQPTLCDSCFCDAATPPCGR